MESTRLSHLQTARFGPNPQTGSRFGRRSAGQKMSDGATSGPRVRQKIYVWRLWEANESDGGGRAPCDVTLHEASKTLELSPTEKSGWQFWVLQSAAVRLSANLSFLCGINDVWWLHIFSYSFLFFLRTDGLGKERTKEERTKKIKEKRGEKKNLKKRE